MYLKSLVLSMSLRIFFGVQISALRPFFKNPAIVEIAGFFFVINAFRVFDPVQI